MKKTKEIGYSRQVVYNYDELKEKLEQLALQGWKLKEVSLYTIELEECEPAPLEYSFMFLESEEIPTQLIELCEESGWEYITKWIETLVFCTALEDATPIENDEQLKLQAIHKSMKKDYLPKQIKQTILYTLGFVLLLAMDSKYQEIFTSVHIYSIIAIPIIACQLLIEVFQYLHWYTKSKKSIEQNGDCIKPLNLKILNISINVAISIMSILVISSVIPPVILVILSIAILIFCIIIVLTKQQIKVNDKYRLALLTYLCVAPLLVRGILYADNTNDIYLGIFDRYQYSVEIIEESRTIFTSSSSYKVDISDKNSYIRLDIYDSKFDFINETILLELLDINSVEGSWWENVYQHDYSSVWAEYFSDTVDEKEILKSEYIAVTENKIFKIQFFRNIDEDMKVDVISNLLF